MHSDDDFYEERIARFVELAEAAQDASARASEMLLKVTYARLASQWIQLAQMAARMTKLAAEAKTPLPGFDGDHQLN